MINTADKSIDVPCKARLSLPENTSQVAWVRMGVLCCLLLGFLVLKLLYNPYPVGDFGYDGSFYYQIARHVSEGHGLLTSVSLYHQGIMALPQPSTIYPIWPLVLGAGGALIGLENAARILPEIFFLFSLVILYFLTNVLVRLVRPTVENGDMTSTWVDIGHWAVILFGCNHTFFRFTSLPYTEALAFSFGFAAFLALVKFAPGPSIGWGVVAGTLASLAYLTRSQLIGVSAAIVIMPILLSMKNSEYRWTALATSLAVALPILAWITYLLVVAHPFQPRMLLDFAAYHETAELAPLHYLVNVESVWELIWDRVQGVFVAFDLTGKYSYVRSFGVSAYLPVLLLLYLWGRSSNRIQKLWSFLSPQTLSLFSVVLASVICLAPVHAFHADYQMPYLFHWRHGLPMVLLIVIAVGYFAYHQNVWFRRGAVLLMVLSLTPNAVAMNTTFILESQIQGPTPIEREFIEWLAKQTPQPLFATTRAWAWGAYTEGRFHWVACNESREQMLAYLQVVQVDHLITMENEQRCAFYQSIKEMLVPVQKFADESQEISVWHVNKRILHNEIVSNSSMQIQSTKNRIGLGYQADMANHVGVQLGKAL